MSYKRLLICILGGVISAIICISGGIIRGAVTGLSFILFSSILNRIMIGFIIGISGWKKLNYILHGAVIGLLVSITKSLTFLPADKLSFILFTSAGIIYGIFIEILSTNLFKAGIKAG